MKRWWPTLLGFVLFTVAATVSAGPGMQLGRVTLGRAPAPTLNNPARMTMRGRFVGRIGGIAFSKQAKPGMPVNQISIAYDAKSVDGSRHSVTINGTGYPLPLHDWQAVPTARYADTDQHSILTAFGDLSTEDETVLAQRNGSFVFNYHPAINDTLLGLRLMQADVLILLPEAADLPKENDRYLLGGGETEPNITSNQSGWERLTRKVDALTRKEGTYHSYVLSDDGVNIGLSVVANRIMITGDPVYRFWRWRYESPSYDQMTPAIAARRSLATATARMAPGAKRIWLLGQIRTASRALVTAGVLRRIAPDGDFAPLHNAALEDYVVRLRVMKGGAEVEQLPTFDLVLSDARTLSQANPAVHEAVTVMMRNAALFRYIRVRNPTSWRAYVRGLPARDRILPIVRTPTTLDRSPASTPAPSTGTPLRTSPVAPLPAASAPRVP